MSDPESNLVGKLAEEFLARQRRGERPAIAEYTAKYPDLADEIVELFQALLMMEDLKPATSDATGEYAGGPDRLPRLERLGDFRILREIGRGGMGIVYEAEQESLGRRVALKVLPAAALLDSHQQKRFQREAKAAARLHHTNIVPVFGVGEHEGVLYYVMQYIQGLALDEVLAEIQRLRKARVPSDSLKPRVSPTPIGGAAGQGNVTAANVAQALMTGPFTPRVVAGDSFKVPDQAGDPKDRAQQDVDRGKETSPICRSASGLAASTSSSVTLPGASGHSTLGESGQHYWQSVARIGIQVADALEYAHNQGLYHRDIKPSNLLLDTHGTVWVTDFGLAKAAAEGDNLTHTGDIVGTLRYMAPERFQGLSDVRSDIYSLGLTLYEMLVLRPAFDETDRNRLIQQVTHEEPAPPRKLNRGVPLDLETIVLKAIEREPARRYPTAAAFADDLKRFVDDKPILARRVSMYERFWRWCRRNPLVAGLTAGVAALLVVVALVSSIAAVRFGTLAAQESRARQKADDALAKAERARSRAETANQARLTAELARANAEKARRQEEEQRRQAETAGRQKAEAAQKEAEANFQQARKAVEDYLTRVSESRLLREPGLQPLRKELLESALVYYQRFLKKRGHDPALQKDLAAGTMRVARINAEIGSPTLALKTYQEALRILNQIAPADPSVQLSRVAAHQAVGNLQRQLGNLDAALKSLQEAYGILLTISPQKPNKQVKITTLKGGYVTGVKAHSSANPEILARFAGVLNDMGAVHERAGALGLALMRYLEALYIQQNATLGKEVLVKKEKLTNTDPVDTRGRHYKVIHFQLKAGATYTMDLESLNNSFTPFLRLEGVAGAFLDGTPSRARLRFQPASSAICRIIVTTTKRGETGTYNLTIHQGSELLAGPEHGLANQWVRLGNLESTLEVFPEALASFREAQNILKRLVRRYPRHESLVDFQRDLAETDEKIGGLQVRTGSLRQALKSYREALATRERLAGQNPAVTEYQSELAGTYLSLGVLEARANQLEAALHSLQQAVDRQRPLVERAPQVQDFLRTLSRQYRELGAVQHRMGRLVDAGQSLQEALRFLERLAPLQAEDHYHLALVRAMKSTLVGAGKSDLSPAEKAQRKNEADLALAALRRAVAAGYKDLEHLQNDADLSPLRARKDFQALLADVQKHSKALVWLEDLEAAKAQAAREHKDLFLWYDKSNQGTPLGRVFRKTHLAQEAFFDYASKHFVIVNLDIPTIKKPNNLETALALVTQWQVRLSPTTILADALGRPYAKNAGVNLEGSVAAYLKQLDSSRQVRIRRDEFLAKAAASKGLEKAQWLATALNVLPGEFVADHGGLIQDLFHLDADDRAGLHARFLADAVAYRLRQVQPLAARKDWAGVIKAVNAILEELRPPATLAADVLAFRGNAHAELEHFDLAAADFARAVQLAPSRNPLWWHYLAHAQIAAGQVDECRRTCLKMLDGFGQQYVVQACSLLPGAVPDTKPLVLLAKRSAPNYFGLRLLGRILYRLGQFDQAAQALEKGIALADPEQIFLPIDMVVLAMSHQQLGHAGLARQWLAKAARQREKRARYLAKHPVENRTLDVWSNRFTELHFLCEAEAMILGSPTSADPKLRLAFARAHARLGKWDKALADYGQAIAQDPEQPLVWLERGRLQERLKKPERAQADFTQALALAAKQAAAHRAAWEMAPTNRDQRATVENAYRRLAWMQEKLGHPDQAADSLVQIQGLWADDPERLYQAADQVARLVPKVAKEMGAAAGRRLADQALAALQRALTAGYDQLEAIDKDPVWAGLHAASHFRTFQTEIQVRTVFGPAAEELRRLQGHLPDKSVMSVAVAPDGRRALSGGYDGTIRLWDLARGVEIRSYDRFYGEALGVVFSPDGRRALIATTAKVVQLWDVEAGQAIRSLRGHTAWVGVAKFLPDGRRALSGGSDGVLRLWDLEIGREIRALKGHQGAIRDVAVSPDGRWALSGGDDKIVHLWDLQTGQELKRLFGHRRDIQSVAFSPHGHRALSGSDDGWAIFWDLDQGTQIRFSYGNGQVIRDVAFAPDGRTALVVGHGRFQLWDLRTGMESYPTSQNGRHVRAAFLPDGRQALTADGDAMVRRWDLSGEVAFAARLAHAGSWPKALAALDQQVKHSPNDPNLRLLQGRLFARHGDWKRAEADFTQILQDSEFAKLAEVWRDRGRCHAMLSHWKQAAADYAQALARSAESERSRIVTELARWEQILARVQTLRPSDAAIGQVTLDRARTRMATMTQKGDWHKAAALVKERQAQRPDDPKTLLLAALFHRFKAQSLRGHSGAAASPEAQDHEKQARKFYEKLPANPAFAGELADFLSATYFGAWEILEPAEMKSAGGATLTRLPDNSILVSGKNPAQDVYTITTRVRPGEIAGLRLEVLPDPSLPRNGPGRAPDGSFVLTEVAAQSQGKNLPWSSATASYSQPGFPVSFAIDGNPRSGWAIGPEAGLARNAVFVFQGTAHAGTSLTIQLHCQWDQYPLRNLGRFRLAVTRNPLVCFRERLAPLGANAWTFLAATYLLRGELDPARATLRQARASSSPATAADHLLWARVQVELKQPDEARRFLDQGFSLLAGAFPDKTLLHLAQETLSRFLAKTPEDVHLLARQAWVQRTLGNPEPADHFPRTLLAVLNRRLTAKPASGADLRLRAEVYAHQGQWDRAAADLQKYFAIDNQVKPRWVQTGWWVVGPYPEDLKTSFAPETNPDPFRPVAAAGPLSGKTPTFLHWRPVGLDRQEFLDLGALFQNASHISAYALVRVYSAEKQQVAVLFGSDDGVRLWLNGKLVHENPDYRTLLRDSDVFPMTLQPGWNTLLAKVVNGIADHALSLRLSRQPADLVRAFFDGGRWQDMDEPTIQKILVALPDQPQALVLGIWFYRGQAEDLRRQKPLPARAAVQADKQALDLYQRLIRLHPAFSARTLTGNIQSQKDIAVGIFFLTKDIERRPADAEALLDRGSLYAEWGQFDRAAADFAEAFQREEPRNPYFWLENAFLRLQVGDRDGYRNLCRRMAERFGSSNKEEDMALLAHTCVLAPGALGDAARVLKIAEQRMAMTGPASLHRFWSPHVLGLALYRAGQYENAIALLAKTVRDYPDWVVTPSNWLVLSMAHQRLHHPEEARQWLDKAARWMRKHQPEAGKRFAPQDWLWRDWLGMQMLSREATALLQAKTASKK